VKVEKGNILDVESGIICHQVNCQGKMGAGLAKGIRNRFPLVYKEYIQEYNTNGIELGMVYITRIDNKLRVANLAAQDRYGKRGRYTDYKAFRKCLKHLTKYVKCEGIEKVYFPYKIGCGYGGGGDWNIIKAMIEKYFPNAIIMKC
jgi:O-acetyl-ADP-ribose deacetylase (regulator of RNase III)